MEILINIDVAQLEQAIEFYQKALDLRLGRRLFETLWPNAWSVFSNLFDGERVRNIAKRLHIAIARVSSSLDTGSS